MTQNQYDPHIPFPGSLADSLVNRGLLSSDQVQVALKEQRLRKRSFEDTVVALGFISEAALAEALSLKSGVEKIELSEVLLDPTLKKWAPKDLAEKYCLLPLTLDGDTLRVAMADVYDLQALEALQQSVGPQIKLCPVIAVESEILQAVEDYYGYDHSVQAVLHEIESKAPSRAEEGEANPTVRLVNAVLLEAIKKKASDIHFEPEGAFLRIRMRLDGILIQTCTLHASYWPALCVRLKVMGGMNIAESRKPQTGRLTFRVAPREVDIRVASHPTIYGENMVVRLLDKTHSLLGLEELGYSETVITQVKFALKKPAGLFIITGPTGCGKTTSLYSLLSYLNTPEVNIMTLEEPVEYQVPWIRQSSIREGALSFAEGVRSILRQDPDIILIGEIRDSETAQMALRAAMTGHQVFSTLHTHDSFGALHRLVELGVSRSLLAGNLMAIVAQRLVRKVCRNCKTKLKMSVSEAASLALESPKYHFSGKGCSRCQGTGYQGRFAVAESLVFDEDLEDLFLSSASRSEIKSLAKRKGYIPMEAEATRRILRGETSLSEVRRVLGI